MTRMGLVLNDSVLVERVIEDFANVVANPINFHNTWKSAHDLGSGSAEGWVRAFQMCCFIWLVVTVLFQLDGDSYRLAFACQPRPSNNHSGSS
jgi:hypothetical protein